MRSARATDLGRPRGVARVADRANEKLRQAHGLAEGSLPLKLIRPVPFVGRHVAVVRDMTRVGAEIGAIGDRAAHAIQTQLDASVSGPEARVALLDTVVTEVARARAGLGRIHLRDHRFVLSPLSGARRRVANGLVSAQSRLDEAGKMAGGIRRMFVGPQATLVLAANNAEMRAGGMPLSAGTIATHDGQIEARGFFQTSFMFLKEPVAVPKEFASLYYPELVAQEWRSTAVSPNWPLIAPIYQRMSEGTATGRVQNVISVDALALRAVLQATGPVEFEGVRYDAGNILQEVLNENYLRFGTGDLTIQLNRAALQGRLAKAVFEALNARPLKLGKLVSSLSTAAKGRHLLAWSSDPDLNLVWQRAGMDGRLNPHALMVNLQNWSGNKLDWYIKPRAAVRTLWVRKGQRRVEVAVTFTNPLRSQTSEAIEGTGNANLRGRPFDEHRVYLTLCIPLSATDAEARDPGFTVAGIDGPVKVVGMHYGVKLGKTRTVRVRFTVPKAEKFVLIPSARVTPIRVQTAHGTVTDAKQVVISP